MDRDQKAASLISDSLGYAGLFTIPGLVGGVLLGDRILAIYGEEFVRGTRVLSLLILAVLVYGYQRQFTNALGGIDQPRAAFKVNGTLIGSNIGMNIVLVYYFGMIGAAIASVSSVLLSLGVGYYLTRQYISLSVPVGLIGRQATAAGGMGVFVLLVDTGVNWMRIDIPNTILTVVLITVGAATYFGLLGLISRDFRTTVVENFPHTGVLRRIR